MCSAHRFRDCPCRLISAPGSSPPLRRLPDPRRTGWGSGTSRVRHQHPPAAATRPRSRRRAGQRCVPPMGNSDSKVRDTPRRPRSTLHAEPIRQKARSGLAPLSADGCASAKGGQNGSICPPCPAHQSETPTWPLGLAPWSHVSTCCLLFVRPHLRLCLYARNRRTCGPRPSASAAGSRRGTPANHAAGHAAQII